MRGRIWLVCVMLALAVPAVSAGMVVAAPRARVAYWVTADLVRGSTGAAGPVGAQTSVFKQGEEVVFRVRVLDIATGQDPGAQGKGLKVLQELGLKVVAYLEDGQSFPMTYGQHPAQPQGREAVAWFWTASWKIPDTYTPPHDAAGLSVPLRGRYVKWWVIVTDKTGASVRFDPVGAGTLLPPVPIVIDKR